MLETSEANVTLSLADLSVEGNTTECGGMDIRLIASRLPARLSETSYAGTHSIPLPVDREARIFVRITQEDGHQAWSSPIYIQKGAGV